MQTVAQIDMHSHPEFLTVLYRTADCAKAKMPDADARILRASMLVMNGHVHVDPLWPGAWIVDSESQAGVAYQVIDNVCTCESYIRHQGTHDGLWYCKHVLSVFLYRRVAQHLVVLPTESLCQAPISEDGEPCCAVQEDCDHEPTWHIGGTHREPQTVHGEVTECVAIKTAAIPPQFIIELHGKQFIQYAGLLAMAHEQGLRELSAEITVHIPDVIAIAKATAVFADGRRFTESADATPGNVTAQIKPHFARMALTRAKARALRDALNVGMCSAEEIE